MYNFYDHISSNYATCRQLSCNGAVFSIFKCPLDKKFADLWSHHNYIIYVAAGRKIWHTSKGPFELTPGTCAFVRKGATIVEQFLDADFCLFVFFIPDDFIAEVIKSKLRAVPPVGKTFDPVIQVENNAAMHGYFQSIVPYFESTREPDQGLMELKFRELILLIADNPANHVIVDYFASLSNEPKNISLQRVMEENYRFNLRLEDYARLSTRSLSTFKRDFQEIYGSSPGKWLLEKRLELANHLLGTEDRTVAEAAFESGFENNSHFSRSFRQRYGISPMVFKKRRGVGCEMA